MSTSKIDSAAADTDPEASPAPQSKKAKKNKSKKKSGESTYKRDQDKKFLSMVRRHILETHNPKQNSLLSDIPNTRGRKIGDTIPISVFPLMAMPYSFETFLVTPIVKEKIKFNYREFKKEAPKFWHPTNKNNSAEFTWSKSMSFRGKKRGERIFTVKIDAGQPMPPSKHDDPAFLLYAFCCLPQTWAIAERNPIDRPKYEITEQSSDWALLTKTRAWRAWGKMFVLQSSEYEKVWFPPPALINKIVSIRTHIAMCYFHCDTLMLRVMTRGMMQTMIGRSSTERCEVFNTPMFEERSMSAPTSSAKKLKVTKCDKCGEFLVPEKRLEFSSTCTMCDDTFFDCSRFRSLADFVIVNSRFDNSGFLPRAEWKRDGDLVERKKNRELRVEEFRLLQEERALRQTTAMIRRLEQGISSIEGAAASMANCTSLRITMGSENIKNVIAGKKNAASNAISFRNGQINLSDFSGVDAAPRSAKKKKRKRKRKH